MPDEPNLSLFSIYIYLIFLKRKTLYEDKKIEFNGILKVDMKQFIESLKEEDISKDLIDKDTAIEMLETIYLDKVKV